MRKMPKDFDEFHSIAVAFELSFATGRALYACNRKQMGWPNKSQTGYCVPQDPLVLMKSARVSTAKRWHEHWLRGGHIRSLKHTVAQWNERRRGYDAEYRANLKKWGIK